MTENRFVVTHACGHERLWKSPWDVLDLAAAVAALPRGRRAWHWTHPPRCVLDFQQVTALSGAPCKLVPGFAAGARCTGEVGQPVVREIGGRIFLSACGVAMAAVARRRRRRYGSRHRPSLQELRARAAHNFPRLAFDDGADAR